MSGKRGVARRILGVEVADDNEEDHRKNFGI
jgi:hypothetical protein